MSNRFSYCTTHSFSDSVFLFHLPQSASLRDFMRVQRTLIDSGLVTKNRSEGRGAKGDDCSSLRQVQAFPRSFRRVRDPELRSTARARIPHGPDEEVFWHWQTGGGHPNGAKPAGPRAMKAGLLRGGGRTHMAQRTLRRFVTVGVLAAALAIAAATPAHARDLGPTVRPWGWLQDLWTRGVSVLWNWSATPAIPRDSGNAGDLQKAGPGVDPNGSTTPGSPNTSGPTCSTCSDQGPGVDPNG